MRGKYTHRNDRIAQELAKAHSRGRDRHEWEMAKARMAKTNINNH